MQEVGALWRFFLEYFLSEMSNCCQQLLGIPGQSIQKEESLQRRWYGCWSIGGRERQSIGDDNPDLGRLLGDAQPSLQVT